MTPYSAESPVTSEGRLWQRRGYGWVGRDGLASLSADSAAGLGLSVGTNEDERVMVVVMMLAIQSTPVQNLRIVCPAMARC